MNPLQLENAIVFIVLTLAIIARALHVDIFLSLSIFE